MAYCTRCGGELRDGDGFCGRCGLRVGLTTTGGMPLGDGRASYLRPGIILVCIIALMGLGVMAIYHVSSGSTNSGRVAQLRAPVPTPTPVPPPFGTDSYSIGAGHYETVTLTNTRTPGTLEGYFSTTPTQDDIGFSVHAPSGSYLVNLPRVAGRYDFHYTLTEVGPYVVTWDNSYSLFTGKVVTVYWRAYSPSVH